MNRLYKQEISLRYNFTLKCHKWNQFSITILFTYSVNVENYLICLSIVRFDERRAKLSSSD